MSMRTQIFVWMSDCLWAQRAIRRKHGIRSSLYVAMSPYRILIASLCASISSCPACVAAGDSHELSVEPSETRICPLPRRLSETETCIPTAAQKRFMLQVERHMVSGPSPTAGTAEGPRPRLGVGALVVDSPLSWDPGGVKSSETAALIRFGRLQLSWSWSYFTGWLAAPIVVMITVGIVWHVGGAQLVRRALPVGAAVSLCVLLGLWTSRWGWPLESFSSTTACMTVVIVMELRTLERFIVRLTHKFLGTILGGIMAVMGAFVSGLTDNHTAVAVCFCFVVFMVDAAWGLQFQRLSSCFATASATFVLVFFGFIQSGWPAVWARLISVFIGEFLAFLCTMFFDFICWDVMSSLSTIAIIEKSSEIFKLSLVALDFAFIRNEISAAVDDQSVRCVAARRYQDIVRDFFSLDKVLVPDADTLRDLAKNSGFRCLPMDIRVSMLQAECDACWSDMQMVRGLGAVMQRLRAPIDKAAPNYSSLFKIVYPVFIKSSALAHAAQLEHEQWRLQAKRLEVIRMLLHSIQNSFTVFFHHKSLFRAVEEALRRRPEYQRVEVLPAMVEVCASLQRALSVLIDVRRDMELGGSTFWRFGSFCQCLEFIIGDLGSLALTCLQIAQVPEKGNEDLFTVLRKFAIVDPKELEVVADLIEENERKLRANQKQVVGRAGDDDEDFAEG